MNALILGRNAIQSNGVNHSKQKDLDQALLITH
jgi:hypothetical protein